MLATNALRIQASRHFVALIALLVVAAFASAGFAQWTEPDTPIRRLLKQADTDGDGQLSPAERQAAREKIRAFQEQQRQRRDNLGSGDALGSAVQTIAATIDPENTTLYKPAPGHFPGDEGRTPVAVAVEIVLPGNGDQRDIPLRVSVQRAPGNALVQPAPYPVVIFCHGALGSKDGYLALTEFWASHGYVVIQPTFGDSLSLMSPEEKQKITSIGQLLSSDHVTSQWDDRPREVSRIIDQLAEIEKRVWNTRPQGALFSTFDRDRIAVTGHSYGAHTTMLLTGAEPGNGALKLADPRIKAGIALSPQGTSATFKAEQFEKFAVPMLFVTGDNDGSPMPGQLDKKGPWRREAYDGAPAGDRYLLWLDDAHHNLGGISGATFPGAGPSSPDQVLLVQSTTLAFLDAYLCNVPEAKKYLTTDTVREASDDIAHLENKLE